MNSEKDKKFFIYLDIIAAAKEILKGLMRDWSVHYKALNLSWKGNDMVTNSNKGILQ